MSETTKCLVSLVHSSHQIYEAAIIISPSLQVKKKLKFKDIKYSQSFGGEGIQIPNFLEFRANKPNQHLLATLT